MFDSRLDDRSLFLRARTILATAEPIENGVIGISGDRISHVGKWNETGSSFDPSCVVDLGDVVLCPGFVNAHCHLDYTAMAGQLVSPRHFPDWIKSLLALRSGLIYTDFAESWVSGAKMLLQSGVTTVADVESVPELLPEVWNATPLRVHSFIEMTGVKSRRPPMEILDEALETVHRLSRERDGDSDGSTILADTNRSGLSPHAPYSTMPELMRLTAEVATRENLKLTIHVSESIDEFEMFVNARGEMYEWLLKNLRDNSDCGRRSPIATLAQYGVLSPNLLAIHANYLAPGDSELLAASGSTVVHCPRSHAFFGHQAFPLKELAEAGINICLGTDSLATVTKEGRQLPTLDFFSELRSFTKSHPDLNPKTILQMAMCNGARALGIESGELAEGCLADMIAIPFSGTSTDVVDAIIHHAGPVSASMIGGNWALQPN